MRRYLLIPVLLILSFQFVWAAAASYCRHESGPAKHFGHHEHQHEGGAPGDDRDSPNPPLADEDCAFCNFGTAAAISAAVDQSQAIVMFAPQFQYQLHYKSYIPPGLERPDRHPAA